MHYTLIPMAPFYLGTRSLARLSGVHADLFRVLKRAIQLSTVDFVVVEGLRTLSRQKLLMASGASQTLKSNHITGRACDLVPCVGRTISWSTPLFYPVALAMKQAGDELGVKLRWGGCWNKTMDQWADPGKALDRYVADRRKIGLRSFIDCPHFELA